MHPFSYLFSYFPIYETLVSLLTQVLVLPLEGTLHWPSATHEIPAMQESPAPENHQFTGLPPVNLPITSGFPSTRGKAEITTHKF